MFGKKGRIPRQGLIAPKKNGGGDTIMSNEQRARSSKQDADLNDGPQYTNRQVPQGGSPGSINSAQSRTRASKMVSDGNAAHGVARTAGRQQTPTGAGNGGRVGSAQTRSRASKMADEGREQNGPTWNGRYWPNDPMGSTGTTLRSQKRAATGAMPDNDWENNGPIRAAKGGSVVVSPSGRGEAIPDWKKLHGTPSGRGEPRGDTHRMSGVPGGKGEPHSSDMPHEPEHAAKGGAVMPRRMMPMRPKAPPMRPAGMPTGGGSPGSIAGQPRGMGFGPSAMMGSAKGGSMKLGGGGRFAALKSKLSGKVRDPGAVAASIGRKKLGADRFNKMAATGRRRSESAR